MNGTMYTILYNTMLIYQEWDLEYALCVSITMISACDDLQVSNTMIDHATD